MSESTDQFAGMPMPPQPREFDYSLERDELERFLRWSVLNLPAARRMIRFQRVGMAVLGLLPVLARVRDIDVTSLVIAGMGLAIPLAAAWYIPPWLAARRAEDSIYVEKRSLGRWHLQVEPSGIRYESPLGSGACEWSALDLVVLVEQALYLINSTTGRCILIPRDAFRDEGDMRAFAESSRVAIASART